MKFWRLEEPEYESDYHQIYINGDLEHPFGLPGVECDVCGQTSGGSRILPYECPADLRGHKNLTVRWAIPLEEFKQLRQEVLREFKTAGVPVSKLQPGDDFQPCYLDVPSKPRADFLWPSLGSLLVSERMKDLLTEYCADDIACCPAQLRKIGRNEAKLPVPIPTTGEPADMIKEVPSARSVSDVGPYFEVCILKESGLPPGGEPVKVCSGCGRPEINKAKREIRMLDHMWKGHQIFFLATTLYILITDDLKKIIEQAGPTNVVFAKIWQDDDPGLLETTSGGRDRTESG
jgi:hypothetical protein